MDPAEAVRAIFDRAVDLPPEEREAFVLANSPDAPTASTVLQLLAHHEASTGFLARPLLQRRTTMPERVAEFEIVREVGRGGMGVVYEARDTVLHRRVALKVLTPHLLGSEQAIARLRQEARAVAGLQHPGIVVVHRSGVDQDLHYLVMEYVEGETLAMRLAGRSAGGARGNGARDRIRETASLISSVADALEHAHRHGVIHRDVKPSNIILPADGPPKLTDFGIARILTEPALTTTGNLAGTAVYMSPEQAAGAALGVDHRADVYSLGVVMYECIAGRPPFTGETLEGILHAIRTDSAPRLRSLAPAAPKDLETICHKAIERSPAHRYQTASQFSADLRCWLRGDPILATPPSVGRRVGRWAGRHRRALVVGAMGALAMTSGGLAWRAESMRRAQRCMLSISSDAPVEVFVRAMGATAPSAPTRLGTTPVRARLLPGQYRVTAVGAGGRFNEASLFLATPDSATSVHLPLPSEEEATAGMIRIEAGEHLLGSASRSGVQAERRVTLPAFYLDAAEVSNAEYLRFVHATGREQPLHWRQFGYDDALADHPVVCVSWEDAQAYARWAGKRLPTSDEWEAAMRLPDARLLPWGAERPATISVATLEDRERIESANEETAYMEYARRSRPVRMDPAPSPLGFRHASTNVQEMTDTIIPGPTAQQVVRGASWFNTPEYCDLTLVRTRPVVFIDPVTGEPVWARSMSVGFRCARSAAPLPEE